MSVASDKLIHDEDLDDIAQRMGLSGKDELLGRREGPSPQPVVTFIYLEVKEWYVRLGNSLKPESWGTTLIVSGTDHHGSPAKGAYLDFHRDTSSPKPPTYNPTTGMMYINFGFDQIEHVKEVLSLVGGAKKVMIYFRDFPGGHRWAEIHHSSHP